MKKFTWVILVSLFAMMLVWCGSNTDTPKNDDSTLWQDQQQIMTVQNWDSIAVDYVGTSAEGLFDTNLPEVAQEYDAANPDADSVYNEQRNYVPLAFEVGAAQMIPWFDKGVIGMKEGETKELVLEPSDAYGEYNEELIQTVPLDNFTDNGLEIVVWETYNFGFTQGTVLEIDEDTNEVIIDFNPKLAWKTLTFEVTIVSITKKEDIQAVVENLPADSNDVFVDDLE